MPYEVFTPPPGIAGASGVGVHDHHLLIVSDDSPGWYLRVPLPPVPSVLPIPTEFPNKHPMLGGINAGAALPLDIESIDLLGNDRVVLLSERLRSLTDEDGPFFVNSAAFITT